LADLINIESFYDQDERRRGSEEEEFGDGWTSAQRPGMKFQVAWVKDTGEIYAMGEPLGTAVEDPFGDYEVLQLPSGSVQVEVLGKADDAELDRLLGNWQEEMKEENSLDRLRLRVQRESEGGSATDPV
jgi:hypothetical protein